MRRFVILSLLLLCSMAGFTQSSAKIKEARERLSRAGAVWRVESTSYLSVSLEYPLRYPTTDPEVAARAFLGDYGRALGLEDINDLALYRSNEGVDGGHYLRYRQLHAGIPVLSGEVTLEVGANGTVKGLAGALLPNNFFAPAPAPQNPSHPDAFFHRRARAALSDLYSFAHQWNVMEEAPLWVSRNPWQPTPNDPLRLTRVFTVTEPAGFEEQKVYLDAATGELIFRHQEHCDLSRRLYHSIPTRSNIVWEEGDQFPGFLSDEDEEMLIATQETHSFFFRTFGYWSYNNRNGQMRGITNARLNNCPNARAGRNIISICEGVVADDVVAHEWTHTYINDMNGLIYAFESGAINEGYADIFGECLDLLNDRGNDTNDQQLRTTCVEDNMRWFIAEDAVAIDTTLRDLWFPECKEDASSRDSPFFMCSPGETDAVHTNSGLVNRTFVLLTDGGVVDGDTIQGIGMTKALHIFHHANLNYITRVTNFFAFADMLLRSAHNLVGTDLPALTLVDMPTTFSGEIIDSTDVLQLEKAIHATQLRGESPCPTFPALAQNPPSACATALLPGLIPLLQQDWEDSLGTWTVTQTPVNTPTWDDKPWRISDDLPDGRAGLGVFAPNPKVGDCRLDLDNGMVSLTSPTVEIPAGESDFRLTFDHYFALQEEFDGGVLYVATNSEDFRMIPDSAFLFNGYNGKLKSSFENDNPLAGESAFHGADERSTSGTWGRSIVDLALAGVEGGDNIKLRWALGHDGCDGWLGWFIDEISIGFCGGALPTNILSLTARPQKDRVLLSWATAEEQNNAGFYVERRPVAGGRFRELGFVPAATGDYEFTDSDVQAGAAYVYRLRQQDRDGTEHYSNLLTVRLPDSEELRVYPNPTQDLLTINAPASAKAAELYDGIGRLTARTLLSNGTGEIATKNLPVGVYYLRVGKLIRRVVR